jgi:hypothetical protein
MIVDSMTGKAKATTRALAYDPEDPQSVRTCKKLLDVYQAVLVSPYRHMLARLGFMRTDQRRGETVPEWHDRVRKLYGRAYPAQEATAETALVMTDKFIYGLRHADVRVAVWTEIALDQDITYTRALREAIKQTENFPVKPVEQATDRQVELEYLARARFPCEKCGQTGHMREECGEEKTTWANGNDKQAIVRAIRRAILAVVRTASGN